jgi:[methyl-Co(III) methanol-specific corrinoid protein]:coenzyme M methyltransferase
VLAFLAGEQLSPVPCFSGLINVIQEGLNNQSKDLLGYHLSEVHQDPVKMARAAASSHRLFGFESAVVPLDICVEAEALGAKVDFLENQDTPQFPTVERPAANGLEELDLSAPEHLLKQGRIPLVIEAIKLLKEDVGHEVAIGAWVPGPFTLAMYVFEPGMLLSLVVDEPDKVGRHLDSLTGVLIQVAQSYRNAGADFITVHEMGGSPGYLGPITFKKLVLSRLQRLLAALPPPRGLSICGRTNSAMPLMVKSGADVLHVDQLNNLEQSRKTIGPEPLLVGNIDPVAVLAHGREADVVQAVDAALSTGANAIWPGCDLSPATPVNNLRAMVEATQAASNRLKRLNSDMSDTINE